MEARLNVHIIRARLKGVKAAKLLDRLVLNLDLLHVTKPLYVSKETYVLIPVTVLMLAHRLSKNANLSLF